MTWLWYLLYIILGLITSIASAIWFLHNKTSISESGFYGVASGIIWPLTLVFVIFAGLCELTGRIANRIDYWVAEKGL